MHGLDYWKHTSAHGRIGFLNKAQALASRRVYTGESGVGRSSERRKEELSPKNCSKIPGTIYVLTLSYNIIKGILNWQGNQWRNKTSI